MDYLRKHLGQDEPLLAGIVQNCRLVHLKKGQKLPARGHGKTDAYFVEEGLLRYFSVDERGREHILQFAPQGWFISDRLQSFDDDKTFFIDAWEDSRVMMLTEEVINDLEENSTLYRKFNFRLMQKHIAHLQYRINELLSATAEERYLRFIDVYPDILLRVPQSMVASYLGITPESLSRVRKELAAKHHKNPS